MEPPLPAQITGNLICVGPDQDVDITTKYSDYRKTELGYVIPYAIDVDFGGQFGLTIAVKKVELNKTIDPAIFAMPK